MRPLLCILVCLAACARLEAIGKPPNFTPLEGSYQHHAMYSTPLPEDILPDTPAAGSSLWAADRMSLFGERRAARRGDILTVVIEIDDSAEITNATGRNRSGSESMGIPEFFGIPQRLNEKLPAGASLAQAVESSSSSGYSGAGSVSRNEQLTLRIAATVVDELANGVLRIEGMQQVRVNYELRELTIAGYVRPSDISRQNEITYDKIAGAHISYGGRGQITDVQQPRYGQQITDVILPF